MVGHQESLPIQLKLQLLCSDKVQKIICMKKGASGFPTTGFSVALIRICIIAFKNPDQSIVLVLSN